MRLNFINQIKQTLLVLCVLLTACQKNNTVATSPSAVTLYKILQDDYGDFTILKAAVDRAGMVGQLTDVQNLTLFAPTDAAFISAGYPDVAAINNTDPETLRQIIKNCLLDKTFEIAPLPTGVSTIPNLNNQLLRVEKKATGSVYINGADVTNKDKKATNGILHVINSLLYAKQSSIYQIISNNQNLTFLKAAILKASQGSTNILNLLSDAGSFTFFAPTNAGFIAEGYPTIASVTAADANKLGNLLLYHIVKDIKYSFDFIDSTQVPAYNNQLLFINKTNLNLNRVDNTSGYVNGNLFNRSTANLLADNGVVHVVDKVLTAPIGNTLQTVNSIVLTSPNKLTYLSAAIARASLSGTNFSKLLTDDEPYALLAPTDAAFIAGGYATIAAVNAADPNVLANILKYHLLKGKRYLYKIPENTNPIALNGTSFTVYLVSNAKVIRGTNNSLDATFIKSDISTTNGVVHVISQLLKP